MKDPKLAEVARLAGVSPGTVSNAFNRPNVVAADTLERVMMAVSELNYVPNGAARQLRVGISHTVGLVLHDLTNPFFAALGEGAEDWAGRHGSSLLIATTNGSSDKQNEYLVLFEEQRVQGVLLQPNDPFRASIDRLRSRGIPVVLLDAPPPDLHVPSVSGDDLSGGRLAAHHLLSIGRRRLLILSGPITERAFAERAQGAMEAIHQVEGASGRVVAVEATIAAGRAAGSSIDHTEFDGVIAGNDVIALGALHAFMERGVRVPAEVAIIGYDDIDVAAAAGVPLTTVRQSARGMGRRAIELLIETIADPTRGDRVVFHPELIARQSTGR
jgi:LacI family transcriptional regulator